MSHPTQPPERPSAGFSIVELVIAILILAIGVLGIASATGYMVRQITLAEVTSERAAAVQLVVERLKSTPYDSLDIGSDTVGNYVINWGSVDDGVITRLFAVETLGPGLQRGTGPMPYLSNNVADTFLVRLVKRR
jgi:hypothetical protein